MPSRRHISAFAVLAVGGLLLTGCAANSTSSEGAGASEDSSSSSSDMNTSTDQSVAEACNELQAGLSESTSALQEGVSQLSADPDAAVQKLNAFVDEFAAVRAGLGNAEVKAQADSAGVAFGELVAQAETAAADPAALDMNAFMETTENVQAELTAIGEVCTAG